MGAQLIMSAYGWLRPHFEGEYIHEGVFALEDIIDILIVRRYPLPGCAAMRRLSSVNRLGLSSYEGLIVMLPNVKVKDGEGGGYK